MSEKKKYKTGNEMGIRGRRTVAYIVLALVSFLCLFWFYVLFINATRSHGELTKGFTPLPSSHLLDNWSSMMHGNLPVWTGMINSFIIAATSTLLSVYFSTMTAYAIHAYNFKLKKFIHMKVLRAGNQK